MESWLHIIGHTASLSRVYSQGLFRMDTTFAENEMELTPVCDRVFLGLHFEAGPCEICDLQSGTKTRPWHKPAAFPLQVILGSSILICYIPKISEWADHLQSWLSIGASSSTLHFLLELSESVTAPLCFHFRLPLRLSFQRTRPNSGGQPLVGFTRLDYETYLQLFSMSRSFSFMTNLKKIYAVVTKTFFASEEPTFREEKVRFFDTVFTCFKCHPYAQ